MGGLAGCRGGGGGSSLVVLVSEKPNLVSEKSGKSQGILFICGAGNPAYTRLFRWPEFYWGHKAWHFLSYNDMILLKPHNLYNAIMN